MLPLGTRDECLKGGSLRWLPIVNWNFDISDVFAMGEWAIVSTKNMAATFVKFSSSFVHKPVCRLIVGGIRCDNYRDATYVQVRLRVAV